MLNFQLEQLMELSIKKVVDGLTSPSKVIRWTNDSIVRPKRDHYMTSLKSRYLFDHEWDLAIILDACRYDIAAEEIVRHSLNIGTPERVYSTGSISYEWIERTFSAAPESTLRETAYITGNAYSNHVPSESLRYVDKVWEYAWDPDLETIPPRALTNRTIDAMRKDRADRYVVHYMQPHLPPVGDADYDIPGWVPNEGAPGRANTDTIGNGWDLISKSGMDPKPVVQAYRENLRTVFDELELLLDNVDAPKVVVTADHGNYLDERGRWGHPSVQTHGAVRNVPWFETTATDKHTHEPGSYEIPHDSADRKELLGDLSYLKS
jgi:hypothetical protein